MKKELPPGVIVGLLILLVGGIVMGFVISQNSQPPVVDIKKQLTPEDLADPDPPRGRRNSETGATGGVD